MPTSSDINQLQAEKTSKFDSRVAGARSFYSSYGDYILKYRGGMQPGFLAAIAQWESGGKMSSAGDPKLGEVGFFQLEASLPGKFCSPDIRNTPEGNIFLACLEYQAVANRLKEEFPALIWNGTPDQWMMARLSFAIGYGGTVKCIQAAPKWPGNTYGAVKHWANETGAMSLGSQSASKVWFRINAVEVQYQIGQHTAPFLAFSTPQKIPAPSGVRYCVPAKTYGTLGLSATDLLIATVAGIAAYTLL